MKNLKFHTGRGGRYNNPGYVTFTGFESITEGHTFDDLFPNDDWSIVRDPAENELDFEINEDGTGYVDDDGYYDSTHVVKENELNKKQIAALIREKDSHRDREEIVRVLTEHYAEYMPEEEVEED